MSGEEGEALEEERDTPVPMQMAKESENHESERMSSEMRSSDLSSSEKQSVEKSKMSEREMTIPTEDPIENVVVAVNQTDESVERFSFNLKAEEMIKPAKSKENITSKNGPN